MDYGSMVKFIRGRLGSCYSNSSYYNEISTWLEWYKGYVPSVHVAKISNGIEIRERKLYRLKMAKRVCFFDVGKMTPI